MHRRTGRVLAIVTPYVTDRLTLDDFHMAAVQDILDHKASVLVVSTDESADSAAVEHTLDMARGADLLCRTWLRGPVRRTYHAEGSILYVPCRSSMDRRDDRAWVCVVVTLMGALLPESNLSANLVRCVFCQLQEQR